MSQVLVRDALDIWEAAVEAVKPRSLFSSLTSVVGDWLLLRDEAVDLRGFERIVVIGAGKASAAMAVEFERQCLSKIRQTIDVRGWINAPEGTFTASQSGRIHLHAARPAGSNVPTQEAVDGTRKIVELAKSCTAKDLCIVLLSGGGSALLVDPIPGITLADKQSVALRVAAAGGNIQQLNAIRRAISRVKGGQLARSCGAGKIVTLIISDVLGDPLETIASGPTFQSEDPVIPLAQRALKELGIDRDPELARVVDAISRWSSKAPKCEQDRPARPVAHIVLGNNATAVDAAGVKAVELGYRYVMQSARHSEGDVAQVAKSAVSAIEQMLTHGETDCWISGGEPTVKLPDAGVCGKGGRNQQLALLTMIELAKCHAHASHLDGSIAVTFLSAGTDGEDGPTDAAGAWFDEHSWDRSIQIGMRGTDYAARADAYAFFDRLGELIRSGPTGTNTCDVRVAIAKAGRR